ncbi:uncharacterized protein [Miscanthus floridulus]|uniref:uncharacterized protein n=1 Tax=Miscanthus floridulus TaxID=154761 RepID=UPI00345AC899
MPPPLPDELVEEVLLRFPPENPAGLVRAALVCRRWRRLVSDPGFRRRFRKFHRRPPMLGMLCNAYDYLKKFHFARFIPMTGSCSRRTDFEGLRVLDARHGRVLVRRGRGSVLAVWNSITNEVRELPFPQESNHWTAAVLCSAAASACDHLDCHHLPYLVVFVCSKYDRETFVYTYSSDAAAWSEPVCTQQRYLVKSWMGSALVGNALYFGNLIRGTALKYNWELRRTSSIRLPSLSPDSLLTTTEDGGLGLVTRHVSKLYVWSRKDTHEVDNNAIWERRVIELNTVFPVNVIVKTLYLVGSADGIGIIFMRRGDEVYAIDLKTCKVKKVFEGRSTHSVVAYMSFCTPALGGTCTSEGPSASCSSA